VSLHNYTTADRVLAYYLSHIHLHSVSIFTVTYVEGFTSKPVFVKML